MKGAENMSMRFQCTVVTKHMLTQVHHGHALPNHVGQSVLLCGLSNQGIGQSPGLP